MKWLLLLLLLCSCATPQKKQEEERVSFSVDVEKLGPVGKACGPFDIKYGPVPQGSVETRRFVVNASRAVPLKDIEDVLRVHAKKACVDGVAVLVAVVDDGGVLASSVTAVGWLSRSSLPASRPASHPVSQSEAGRGP